MSETLTPKEAICNPKSMKNTVCYPRCQDQQQNKRRFYKEESMGRDVRRCFHWLSFYTQVRLSQLSLEGMLWKLRWLKVDYP